MTSNAATLRAAVFPRATVQTDALLVLGGAAFVALAAQVSIPLPFTPVPITGQTFAALLVGASLGTARGVASLLLYVLAGIAGAPVFAGASHGWAVLTGPTGGYIVGFTLAAGLMGRLAERRWDHSFSSSVAAMLSATVLIYAVGLAWLAVDLGTGLERTFELGLYPFVVGDLLKVYLAGALLPGAWRLVDRVS